MRCADGRCRPVVRVCREGHTDLDGCGWWHRVSTSRRRGVLRCGPVFQVDCAPVARTGLPCPHGHPLFDVLLPWLQGFALWLLPPVHVGLALAVTLHALMKKEEVHTAVAWIGLAWLAPFGGAFAYWLLGINRIGRTGGPGLAQRPGRARAMRPKPLPCPPMRWRPRWLAWRAWGARSWANPCWGQQCAPLVDGDTAYPPCWLPLMGRSVPSRCRPISSTTTKQAMPL